MKILLTGRGGLLGRECLKIFQADHEILALGRRELDITNMTQVEEAVSRFRPAAIVNCAGFTQVDLCETEREKASQANVTGPRNLALSAVRHRALLVHISSDYVFAGHKPPPAPYLEGDPTAPLSWYGQTKLGGERAIQDITDRHIILRTSWLYGLIGPNFLKKILHLALSPEVPELMVVDDQFGTPTWSHRVAQQLALLLEKGGQGIYHASAEGYCTWYDLARRFLDRLGLDKPLWPCPSSHYLSLAVRPKNSILENQRLKDGASTSCPPGRRT